VTFDLARRLSAEALGTFFLVMAVIGSGIMAETLAGGNTALALLANTLATAAILVVIITIFFSISGAQFNPAVTLVMLLRGEIESGTALLYIAAQITAGALAAIVSHLMFELPPFQFSETARNGFGQLLGEFIATFGLIATILGCLRFRPGALAASVGIYIGAAIWFTASTSFANPAVTIGRSLSNTFAGINPGDAPGFLAAELLGALAAAYLFGWIFAAGARDRGVHEGPVQPGAPGGKRRAGRGD
jgi:glycerol uptake facilitator-like aquaporin